MTRRDIRNLYYITHSGNVGSILRHGVLSHEKVEEKGIEFTAIYDTDIVSRRSSILTPDGKSLWSFANLYLQPRNPMLYRVAMERGVDNLVVVAVNSRILGRPDIMFANGNAAHRSTTIMPASSREQFIRDVADIHDISWWSAEDGSKRRVMANAWCLAGSNHR